jgi:integrase/recombinase XerC
MEPNATLRTLVDQYLLRCEVEGKSPRTVRAYRETLGRFVAAVRRVDFLPKQSVHALRWTSTDPPRPCRSVPPALRGRRQVTPHRPRLPRDARPLPEGDPRLNPAEVRAEDVYVYLGRYTQLTLETRHRYFREVRCFFNWLVESEHLDRSPFRGMRNVRLPQRIVQPFSGADVSLLLAACPLTPLGLRDRAMVLTLLDTGIRCSELVQLNLEDLDLADGRLRVLHGKGNKERVVPFAGHCREAIAAYLAARGSAAGPLFLAASGEGSLRARVALQPNGLKQMLRRLATATGITKVHAHRFRHTFATWAIQHDARELDVQYLLGHSSPDMVRRYSSSYRSEQAALRHVNFSPADQMLA